MVIFDKTWKRLFSRVRARMFRSLKRGFLYLKEELMNDTLCAGYTWCQRPRKILYFCLTRALHEMALINCRIIERVFGRTVMSIILYRYNVGMNF